jgi:hypothetical protein
MATSTPPGGLVCNTSINGKQYYTSVAADVGKVLKSGLTMNFSMVSGVSASCCCLVFSILAFTMNGPTNAGTILVYVCLVCQIFAILYNVYIFYSNKNKLSNIVAESKPCINNPELDKKK